ncbi:class I SAM-dependent methyltransferase [Planctomycetaceae bacterium SH139]
MIDFSILRSPISRSELTQKQPGEFFDLSNNLVAEFHEDEHRIEWIQHNNYPKLDNVLLREIQKYDKWADEQVLNLAAREGTSEFNIDKEDIYRKNPNFRQLDINLSQLVEQNSVLDIGGSCIDSWRFLLAGAKNVHQVEVSCGSQRLGMARLKSKLPERDSQLENFLFHTSPAEYLPFSDGSFDLVFSRSSLHHTDRSLSIDEICRVLKKGGYLLLFEPLQTPLNNFIMHAARKLRRVDRGTDNPLTSQDLNQLKNKFAEVRVAPQRVIDYDAKKTAAWLLRRRSKPAIPVILARK